ncbi:MAG: pyrroloquinoline-quinone synthase [Acidobacteriota bacterium]|jgi:pyrroloquinoline quinone (PQQ) biosynthesis protein C|nr:pyrroloquinoline-quinone synthase [Acidobacteriota bacterium]
MTAATEFAESLLASARLAPVETNPIVAGVIDGRLSRGTVRRYALALAAMAESFPQRISSVLSLCDDYAVRRSLLGNLLEEEGVVGFVPAEGVQIEPERRHGAMGRRFARAAGATDAELDAISSEPARWFTDALRKGDWIAAYSFFAIGFEANVPATFRVLVEPLTAHYGFTGHELEFLYEHFTADERHGAEAAQLIAAAATTDARRASAREGARRGGAAWWAFHRAIAAEHVHA